MKNIEELKEKLEKLKLEEFYLQQNDHWTSEDFKKDDELLEEIRKLEKEIEELC